MLRAIIVEDEASSRETLQNYLSQYCPQVTILVACSNIKEGKSAIQQHDPDVVFLDIEMPYGNGFDLLTSLDHIRFETIFVTAYSHYAIQAIQHSASNYILKPIDIDELINAVDKVASGQHELNTTRVLLENLKHKQNQDTKIVLPVMEGLEVIKARDIVHCEAHDNFTKFHLDNNDTRLICRTLKHHEGQDRVCTIK
ncbi:MAG: response regulator [Bacteroidota bacterium]